MPRVIVKIDLLGAHPEEVSLSELADVLKRLERAILAFLQRPIEDEETEALETQLSAVAEVSPRPTPIVSLIDIQRGSERLVFAADPEGAGAVSAFSRAIRARDFSPVPFGAHRELYNFSEKLQSRGLGFKIVRNKALAIAEAKVPPGKTIPRPAAAQLVTGTTSIVAECTRVGGAAEPKVQLRVAGRSDLLYCGVTQDQARELGDRLYQTVVLHGEATWRTPDWELEDFKVASVSHYEPIDPADVFDELARASAGRWDGVDAEAWVKELRDES